MTVRTTAMPMYSLADGCACCPGAWACSPVACSSWCAAWSVMRPPLLQQVDEGEDRDPDDVDEVPVEAADLDVEVVAGPDAPGEGQEEQGPQPDHAHGHVGPVEPREHVERAAEQVGRQQEPLVGEVAELVDLEPDEHHAER